MPLRKNSAEVQQWLAEAGLVFRGEVRKVKASNVKLVAASPLTAIVRIEQILHGPPQMAAFAGKEITLECAAKPPKAGTSMVFYTRSWFFAENLALREIGRHSAGGSGTDESVADAVTAQNDSLLAGGVDQADAVVAGRVIETRIIEPPRITEHDPMWAEATIEVESVEKGAIQGNRVTLLYPTSMDVLWHKAPKCSAGQRGVWMLKKAEAMGLRAGAFTATGPEDFQNPSHLDAIKAAIRTKGTRK